MKKIMIHSVVFFLLSFQLLAHANGVADNFAVDFIGVGADGKGYVSFASPLQGVLASCANGYPKALAFDMNTVGGKAVYALVLAAQVSGKKIQASGKGTCGVYGVVEDWSWGLIAN